MNLSTKLKALLDLGRVSNLPSVATNVIAAWILAGGGLGTGLVAVMAGAVLLYLAGTTLNDAVDAKFDRENRPERPIPAGVLGVASVWSIGLGYLAAGCLILIFLTQAWIVWVLALALAILVYDVVHKKWEGAVFVMGSCRFFLYLVAASAAVGGLGLQWVVLLWAVALFLYIVGLTFVARGESTAGGVSPMAIVVLAAPLIAGGLSIFTSGGNLVLILCLITLLAWIAFCLRRLSRDHPARIGDFVAGLLAGIPLIDALAIAGPEPGVALVLLMALPASLALQRLVAAT